ncbi:hypothetical protein HBB16_05045 [Pseudonocardia sp. MCCB 268]|nr:hypothetical protein [Pseudonocardia cytotoxica]
MLRPDESTLYRHLRRGSFPVSRSAGATSSPELLERLRAADVRDDGAALI